MTLYNERHMYLIYNLIIVIDMCVPAYRIIALKIVFDKQFELLAAVFFYVQV